MMGTTGEPSTEELKLASAAERYEALAKGLDEHETETAKKTVPRRPRDHELYRQRQSLDEFSN